MECLYRCRGEISLKNHKLVKEFIHAPSMLGRYGEKPFKAKRKEVEAYLRKELSFLDYAPIVLTSAIKGQGVEDILRACGELCGVW